MHYYACLVCYIAPHSFMTIQFILPKMTVMSNTQDYGFALLYGNHETAIKKNHNKKYIYI